MTGPREHLTRAAELAHALLTAPAEAAEAADVHYRAPTTLYTAEIEHHLRRVAEQIGEPLPRLRQDLGACLARPHRSAAHVAAMLRTCVLGDL